MNLIKYLDMKHLDIYERRTRQLCAMRFDDDVWTLHAYGYTVTEIAEILEMDSDLVHDTIIRLWDWDKNAR